MSILSTEDALSAFYATRDSLQSVSKSASLPIIFESREQLLQQKQNSTFASSSPTSSPFQGPCILTIQVPSKQTIRIENVDCTQPQAEISCVTLAHSPSAYNSALAVSAIPSSAQRTSTQTTSVNPVSLLSDKDKKASTMDKKLSGSIPTVSYVSQPSSVSVPSATAIKPQKSVSSINVVDEKRYEPLLVNQNAEDKKIYSKIIPLFEDDPTKQLSTLDLSKRVFGPDGTKNNINRYLYALSKLHILTRVQKSDPSHPEWSLDPFIFDIFS
jgi:hypothetical protein